MNTCLSEHGIFSPFHPTPLTNLHSCRHIPPSGCLANQAPSSKLTSLRSRSHLLPMSMMTIFLKKTAENQSSDRGENQRKDCGRGGSRGGSLLLEPAEALVPAPSQTDSWTIPGNHRMPDCLLSKTAESSGVEAECIVYIHIYIDI